MEGPAAWQEPAVSGLHTVLPAWSPWLPSLMDTGASELEATVTCPCWGTGSFSCPRWLPGSASAVLWGWRHGGRRGRQIEGTAAPKGASRVPREHPSFLRAAPQRLCIGPSQAHHLHTRNAAGTGGPGGAIRACPAWQCGLQTRRELLRVQGRGVFCDRRRQGSSVSSRAISLLPEHQAGLGFHQPDPKTPQPPASLQKQVTPEMAGGGAVLGARCPRGQGKDRSPFLWGGGHGFPPTLISDKVRSPELLKRMLDRGG